MDLWSVRRRYSDLAHWFPVDRWHRVTRERITTALELCYRALLFNSRSIIINLGSGGIDYDLPNPAHIHVDLSLPSLQRVRRAVVASVAALPLRSESADLVLCVGEVINYLPVKAVLGEATRVARAGATVVIELETSESLEWIGTRNFGRDNFETKTFYNDAEEIILLHSWRTTRDLLVDLGFKIVHVSSFHILSSLIYRLLGSPSLAARFAALDSILRHVPLLRHAGASALIVARKLE
jgi:Methyltransferase domain